MNFAARFVRVHPRWVCALIFAAVLAAYLPAIRGGFIWDDDAEVTSPELQPISGLWRIWFEPGATQQYYPVLHTAFWIEHRLWGGAALGYHLANVLLHATAACLVAFVVQRVWSGRASQGAPSAAAWLAALLFALHPVCVESVAWICEQKNTLSIVFYLLAALAYLRWCEAREDRVARPRLYWLATALFVLALLSKTVTATLPAALLIALWWRRGRLAWRDDIQPLLPWFGIAIGIGAVTAWVERRLLGAEGPDFHLTLLERFLLACRAPWFYFEKLVWPSNLTFIYPRWRVDAGQPWQYLFPAATLAALAGLWVYSRRGSRGPLAGTLFFGGSLFPILGFFNVFSFLFSYVADHFQYLACLGLITVAAGGWGQWWESASRGGAAAAGRLKLPVVVALAAVAGLGVLTYRQCRMYRSGVTLYQATLARNPNAWMIEYNLGVTLQDEGRDAEATACYERALQLRPDFPKAQNNLGAELARAGHSDQAIAYYEAAIASARRDIRLTSDQAVAECNLGRALLSVGRSDEAKVHFQRALRLQPDSAAVASALASIGLEAGRTDDAVRGLRAALRANPYSGALHNSLGAALCQAGSRAEAADEFKEAVRLEPDQADFAFNLAADLAQLDRIPEAIAGYQTVLRLRPNSAEACGCLGVLLAESGRLPEAIGCYEQALRLQPNYPEVENELGVAFAKSDRAEQAIAHLEAALRLKPGYADAHKNLGIVLRALGRTQEAEAQFAEAARIEAARSN